MIRIQKGILLQDPRFAIANREALYALVLAFLYFAWWYLAAYGLGSRPVEEYSYIAGFPSWFFLSCIAGFIVFSVLALLMVVFLFRDMPLEKPAGDGRGRMDHD